MYQQQIEAAKEHFGALLEKQLKRVDEMKAQGGFVDYKALEKIVIGVCGGDGIGPAITSQAQRVLEYLLADEVKNGKVAFKKIDGLTIERRAAEMKAIPDDVLAELKACDV
ncbi:MAG: isocitrate/isopropylmalate dehydrogenase family protein, partial [bacterium]|nr:isocitrate/isopropylmalate dehydrogenase family protein [bacterium]